MQHPATTVVREAVVREAVERFAAFTDGPASSAIVAQRFCNALSESQGEAALEIGVRAGGMSAIFCHIARSLAPPSFMVFSVDPWGSAPYMEGGKDVSWGLGYDDGCYVRARLLLAGFPGSVLYRLDADTFLCHLLPNLRWWVEHEPHPQRANFLSFAYLDGRHDGLSVAGELARVAPFVAPGGCVMIDNIDKCPEVRPLFGAMSNFSAEFIPENRVALTRLDRR